MMGIFSALAIEASTERLPVAKRTESSRAVNQAGPKIRRQYSRAQK